MNKEEITLCYQIVDCMKNFRWITSCLIVKLLMTRYQPSFNEKEGFFSKHTFWKALFCKKSIFSWLQANLRNVGFTVEVNYSLCIEILEKWKHNSKSWKLTCEKMSFPRYVSSSACIYSKVYLKFMLTFTQICIHDLH